MRQPRHRPIRGLDPKGRNPILRTEQRAYVLPNPNLTSPPLMLGRATPADMRVVADILRSTADWYEELCAPEDMDQHDVPDDWARKNHERREFFVARIDDEIVGTISLQDAGDVLYLGYVYLHADHVGKGYGKRLLQFARGMAGERGKEGMVLIAHPDAHWAIKAYTRFGFDVVAEEREDVLAWNEGWLAPYYEEGFYLLQYQLAS